VRAWLTTAECAAVLGVSTDYIRAEIRDGRLTAVVITRDPRPGHTRAYRAIRVYPEPWRTYLQRYWPEHAPCST